MHATLLTLSIIIRIVAIAIYCVSIVRGRTKPHRITRLALFFVLTLNFVSALAAHANFGTVVYAGLTCAFGIICFGLSIPYGMGGSNRFDWVCFVIAIGGVVGWQLTGNALLGIWLATAADLVAYIPAFVKTWKHPHTESPWLYILSSFSAALSIIAYQVTTASVFQIYLVFCGLAMLICIYHRRIFRSVPPLST